MATDIVQYKGHEIALDVVKRGRQYSWAYRIDGGAESSCQDRPLSTASLAREEALEDAKWKVNRLAKSGAA